MELNSSFDSDTKKPQNVEQLPPKVVQNPTDQPQIEKIVTIV